MMRITVDRQRCQGYANCVVASPEVFDLSDDGRVDILRADVDDLDSAAVEEAVRSCPASALQLEEVTP